MHLAVIDDVLYKSTPDSGVFTSVSTPAGITTRATTRPCFAKRRRTTIIAGKYYPQEVWFDDLGTVHKAGITAPATAPTLSAGGGDLVGAMIGYYTFAHIDGSGNVRHQSNPSPASDTLTLESDGSINWSAMATSSSDARVTHKRLFRSVEGSIPYWVANVAIGTATYADTVPTATLVLRETLPVKLDADGATILDDGARGIPPDADLVCMYHERMFYARDRTYPDRVWFSKLFEPESVNITEPVNDEEPLGFRRTLDGEAVTAMAVWHDQLLIWTALGCYELQGYGPSTFQIRKISTRYGCIAGHTPILFGDEVLGWLSQEGWCAYDGAFHNLMADTLRDEFRDAYIADQANYENAQAVNDPFYNVVKILIPGSSDTDYYVGHYGIPGVIFWTTDHRTRRDECHATLYGSGRRRAKLFTGSRDGYIRQENVASNADDDGDDYLKRMTLRTKSFLPKRSQAGDDNHGLTLTDYDLFAKFENQAAVVRIWGGDDEAYRGTAQYGPYTITARTQTVAGRTATPKTSTHVGDVKGVSGKTFCFEFYWDSPVGVEYRGIEFNVRPGPQTRPLI